MRMVFGRTKDNSVIQGSHLERGTPMYQLPGGGITRLKSEYMAGVGAAQAQAEADISREMGTDTYGMQNRRIALDAYLNQQRTQNAQTQPTFDARRPVNAEMFNLLGSLTGTSPSFVRQQTDKAIETQAADRGFTPLDFVTKRRMLEDPKFQELYQRNPQRAKDFYASMYNTDMEAEMKANTKELAAARRQAENFLTNQVKNQIARGNLTYNNGKYYRKQENELGQVEWVPVEPAFESLIQQAQQAMQIPNLDEARRTIDIQTPINQGIRAIGGWLDDITTSNPETVARMQVASVRDRLKQPFQNTNFLNPLSVGSSLGAAILGEIQNEKNENTRYWESRPPIPGL